MSQDQDTPPDGIEFRNACIEECAQAVLNYPLPHAPTNALAHDIAEALRALKSPSSTNVRDK